ncbi:PREDICTED: factor VIII intron 22 protein-like isoform X2 [Polistes dominula]|uniref:Factor VIII intron 22 protein-like isoform X2 n=1 Tax=Polistes dominula TaxID=743375 RepID=A0ABM1J428_POLDO|nr:PREDICTED: factor VIII intron 22 protein-like isoform X2 [Polistes dominula]
MSQINQGQKVDTADILARYQIISNKIKKRFLRKPNITEANDQFCALAVECEQKELWQYAGLCYLAAARCHGTLKNASSEISLLIKAGRQFLTAEKKNNDIGCPSLGQENMVTAVSCFRHSSLRCSNQMGFNTLSAGLAIELALSLGANSAGIQQLRKSIDTFPTPKGDHVAALNVLNEFVEFVKTYINIGIRSNYNVILRRCEITRVLLLLILQPSPKRLAPSLVQVLEKYTWVEEGTNNGLDMSEDELLLLQSLVLACQSRDFQVLFELEGELWPYFNAEQKELLHKLIKVLTLQ